MKARLFELSDVKLKPCPFCGRPATTSEKENIKSLPFGCGWIGCQSCRVHIDWVRGDRGKKLAIEAWNRRANNVSNM